MKMNLQKRILISNTITIIICLLMLFLIVGIVMNIFRTQYIKIYMQAIKKKFKE